MTPGYSMTRVMRRLLASLAFMGSVTGALSAPDRVAGVNDHMVPGARPSAFDRGRADVIPL
jgi:hypothetical protein